MPGWERGIGRTIDLSLCTGEHPIQHQGAVVHDYLASSSPQERQSVWGDLLLEERPVTAR